MNNFYYPGLSTETRRIEIAGEEANHMAGVRRLKPGEAVCLFNGNDLKAHCEITKIKTRTVELQVLDFAQLAMPTRRIMLASAMPKGDRIATLLDMATQLGMTDFIPLRCHYSVTTNFDKKIERFRRICVSACKQSGRYYLPVMHAMTNLTQLFDRDEAVYVLADPESDEAPWAINNQHTDIVLIVGPEGGFSDQEQGFFQRQNITRVRLNTAILRIETACVSLLAQLNS